MEDRKKTKEQLVDELAEMRRRIAGLERSETKLKQAERALSESDSRFRALAENSIASIFIIQGEKYVYINPAFTRMTGYDLEDLSSMNFWDLIHPDMRDMVRSRGMARQKKEDVPPRYELKFITRSGRESVGDFGATYTEFNGKPAILASVFDITEHKRIEEALQKSEERYRSIVENAIEGIFQTTPDGRYVSANPALARMYGYDSPRELIDSIANIETDQYVNPLDRITMKMLYEKYGYVEKYETQLYRKDKSRIWISMNARAVRNADGAVLFYEGTAEDITSRKKAEEEKRSLQSQLLQAQKMEAIGTLAGGVAHDFNNILTALIGYGNLLQMNIEKDNPLRVYVDQIIASSEKAANLIQSLLAFSRKQVIELRPYKVRTIITGIEKLLKRLLTEDIELKVTLSDKKSTIMADITQMDQVLMNLATNARDAMPGGGRLTIGATEVELDEAFIAAHGYGQPGTYALISVSDTGTGMDEATKERIFNPFFTTKEVGKGTGLGLSTVYGIIKQHNGYIEVESEPGRGTTFRIYFPVVHAKEQTKESLLLTTRGGTETILVAEDNLAVRNLTREVLTMSGYKVIEAVDGEDAVQKFIEHGDAIAAMILDVVMPKKNGKEVYEEIGKIRPGIKVIFTSGYTGDIVLDKGIRDDIVDFIKKPLLPDELLLKVREVLDR
ncbi:MAG TPA: PAS domain S-box protein [Syntrophorhabdaceae bacterium]|nr:PAS domain S-box protein [Syntrophorhabdaceae bacterium]HNT69009.1 PAS domain S-box protein [Syntrophorhabdaceae bacterium]